MPTAKRCDAATRRPEAYATLLGKLLAAAIIVTPLLAMSFPELNQRSGNSATSRRRRRGVVRRGRAGCRWRRGRGRGRAAVVGRSKRRDAGTASHPWAAPKERPMNLVFYTLFLRKETSDESE